MLDKSPDQPNGATESHPNFPYVDYLFGILDGQELNFTSAGYFAKIINNLFAKRPGTVKFEKMKSNNLVASIHLQRETTTLGKDGQPHLL
jgi:hypothetical protein